MVGFSKEKEQFANGQCVSLGQLTEFVSPTRKWMILPNGNSEQDNCITASEFSHGLGMLSEINTIFQV